VVIAPRPHAVISANNMPMYGFMVFGILIAL
jgi:hypothetical protein